MEEIHGASNEGCLLKLGPHREVGSGQNGVPRYWHYARGHTKTINNKTNKKQQNDRGVRGHSSVA